MADEKAVEKPKARKMLLERALKLGDVEHTEIDLSGLDSLTGADVLFCRKEATRKGGMPGFNHIYDDAYRLELLSRVTGIAAEGFLKLSARDFEGLDAMIQNFFTGADSVEEPTPQQK